MYESPFHPLSKIWPDLHKKTGIAEIFVPDIWKVVSSRDIAAISRETLIKYPLHTLPGFQARFLYGFSIFPSMCDELF